MPIKNYKPTSPGRRGMTVNDWADLTHGNKNQPERTLVEKLKKTGDVPKIELEPTADILAALGQLENRPFLVGFAAETQNLLENARGKLEAKNCDVLVANQAVGDGVGMGAADNEVVILDADGGQEVVERASKAEIAARIWNAVVARRGG